MEQSLSWNMALDSLSSLDAGDLMGFMGIEEELARLTLPVHAKNIRSIRKELLSLFPQEYKSKDRSAFIKLLKNFLSGLVDMPQDSENEMIALASSMDSAIKEYRFDLVHKNNEQMYPEDYFDNIVNDSSILQKFYEEALDHLRTAQLLLLDIEGDPENQEMLNTLFRGIHTIKGSASFLGLRNIEDIAHEYEHLLSLVREHRIQVKNTGVVDILLYAINYFDGILNVLPTCQYQADLIRKNYQTLDIRPTIELARMICKNYETKRIGDILQEMGVLSPAMVDEILKTQEKTGKMFGQIIQEDGLVSSEVFSNSIQVQKNLREQHSSVKVSSSRLNAIVDLAGELVIIQSMIKDGLRRNDMAGVEKTREQLEVISSNLKELALAMGMVPVLELFSRLRIVARNTAKETGKCVNFVLDGEETELDRKLVEALYDPLVHMVRNAIDHGIESPEERVKKGKIETGSLSVSARTIANGIEIVVAEDGAGIHPEILIRKALEKGLISEEHAKICTQNHSEAYKLMFLPGFSTKDQVSAVSGRGVGMDVVKTNIDNIGGRLDIWSRPEKGTRFSIRIPLSLAIIDGFVCMVGERLFVFPFTAIEEVLIWPPMGKKIEYVGDVIEYRNEFIPLRDARQIFSFGTMSELPHHRPLLVLRHDDVLFGMLVDYAIGKQEIVIKSLDEVMGRIPGVSGGSIFGDGSIGFVVNMEYLASGFGFNRSEL